MALISEHLLFGPFRALPFLTPDLGDPLLLRALLPQDRRLDLVDQDAARQEPVEGLQPLLLALDLEPGGQMLEVDAGRDLVDVLAAVASRADEFFDDVRLADAELLHPLREGLLFVGPDAEYGHGFYLYLSSS